MAFSTSEQPPVPQQEDAAKTERKGVAAGCIAMLLILAVLAAAGIWAVKTLIGGIREFSQPDSEGTFPFSEASAVPESPVSAQEGSPSEAEAVRIDGVFADNGAEDIHTLGITLGEFLDAYNAAVPEDYRLDPESPDCEISTYENSCSYYFFLYETGPSDYVSVTLDCLGGTPSADQTIETLFLSDCYQTNGEPPEAPLAVTEGLRALLGSESGAVEKALLTALAGLSQSGETDAVVECGGVELFFSVYEEGGGWSRLALSVWPG